MGIYEDIALVGADIAPGGKSEQLHCPFCEVTHEKSFAVGRTEHGRVWWKCLRASCDASGMLNDKHLIRTKFTSPHTEKRRKKGYEGEIIPLDRAWKFYLRRKFRWSLRQLELSGAAYAPEEDRVAYPILGSRGATAGWVLRTYRIGVKPKAITHLNPTTGSGKISWYMPAEYTSDTPYIVVEDIPSAVCAARWLPSVALNGTDLSADAEGAMIAKIRNVVWCLDEDATAKAYSMWQRTRIMFNTSTILYVQRDLKDMTRKELRTILEGYVREP